jgi:hypothetical protein
MLTQAAGVYKKGAEIPFVMSSKSLPCSFFKEEENR